MLKVKFYEKKIKIKKNIFCTKSEKEGLNTPLFLLSFIAVKLELIALTGLPEQALKLLPWQYLRFSQLLFP